MSNILKKTVKSLPFTWYYKEKFFKKELEKIWSQDWVYVCHIDNLKEKLSYITVSISKFNVIILRDKNNNLAAYLNTCRHRGSVICKETSGKLKTNLLVCPYHQWSYSASDGKLMKTSSLANPSNFDSKKLGLTKIKMKIWNGLVFINFSQKKANWNLKSRFQDYDSTISEIGMEKFEVGHRWKKIINCNWKMFWENYSECLHCPNIHPELSDLVPIYSRRLMDIKEDPNWKKKSLTKHPKFQGGLRQGSETWSMDGSAQDHKIKYLTKKNDFQGHIYITTWPSMFLAIFADHIRIVRILPINNEQTEVSSEWLFESSTNNDKKYNKKNVVDFAILVMCQDGEACELNQKGIYNQEKGSGILMPEEYEVKKFHDWIRKKIKS
tara:strand:+ start:463 stop:1608 length:1146 start_codon:yes stop_codon:yes gene_type:complete